MLPFIFRNKAVYCKNTIFASNCARDEASNAGRRPDIESGSPSVPLADRGLKIDSGAIERERRACIEVYGVHRRPEVLWVDQRSDGVEKQFLPRSVKDACEVLKENWDGSKIEFVEQFKVIAVTRRDASGGSTLSGDINSMVSTGELLSGCESMLRAFERNRQALRFLNSEAFKAWVKGRRV